MKEQTLSENQTSKRFWISWEQLTKDFRPIADPPQPESIKAWWCSGETEDAFTLCAIVDAESEMLAQGIIRIAWDAGGEDSDIGEFRFNEERAADWLPNDRFPITKDWEKQRLGI